MARQGLTKESLSKIIETLIIKNATGKVHTAPDPDQNLIRTGVLDSYSLVALVQCLDDELDIVFDYGLIREENFFSINRIVTFLNEKYKLY